MPLIEKEADGTAFRLIGIGASKLLDGEEADRPDLVNHDQVQGAQVERAIDAVREKFGTAAVGKGRSFKPQHKS